MHNWHSNKFYHNSFKSSNFDFIHSNLLSFKFIIQLRHFRQLSLNTFFKEKKITTS